MTELIEQADVVQDNQALSSLQKEYNSLKRKNARLEKEYNGLLHLYKQAVAMRDYNQREIVRQMRDNQLLRDGSPDDIFLLDADMNVMLCTSSVKKRVSEEPTGRPFLSVIGELFNMTFARQLETVLLEVLIKQENRSIDMQTYTKPGSEGEELFFSFRLSPSFGEEGVVGAVVLAHDNTEMHNANMRAEAATRAKSSFLANMSHEMRTPLNAIIGLSELILESGDLEKDFDDKLEKIRVSGMTLLRIVNDILDLSKIESGKFEINPVKYYVSNLISDVVTLNTIRGEGKPVDFKIRVDEQLPAELMGDDLRIKQIFNNLLSNAFKYTNSGSIEWSVTFERDGSDIRLISSVKDSGIGIKPEDVQVLFQEYNQVDTTTNRKVEGTGLGLSITKRLAEMMGGSISVESEYGKGSTFTVRLAQRVVSFAPIGGKEAEKLMSFRYSDKQRGQRLKLARVNLSYAHVLVVDDVETNLEVAKGMITPYFAKVDCALSGQQAIDMIRAENPRYDAIFMDHMMPGMDGIRATQIIREEIGTDYARSVPIIALTANAIIGSEDMFLSSGFQAFISKPIDMLRLDAVMREWVMDKSREGCEPAPAKTADSEGGGCSLFSGISIAGIDIERCLMTFNNSGGVIVQILRTYAEKTRPLLGILNGSLAASDLKNYAIVVHGVKGSSRGIFAQEAGNAAEELEFAAKAGEIETVRGKHGPFMKIAEELLDNIDAALAAIDAVTNAAKKSAAAPDPAVLDDLRQACADYDMNGVDKAMTQLESYNYESGGELINWLREKINDLCFEEIAQPGAGPWTQ